MDGRGRGRTTATFAARVRDAGTGADVVDVVDALERAGGAETEARAAMEDGDFAEAAARYDVALKTLASSDAVESALELRAVRLRFSCFVGLAMACASLGEHERGLANAHAAFRERAFDEDAKRTRECLVANATAQCGLGNVGAGVLCVVEAMRRGREGDFGGFPEEATREARLETKTRSTPLDRFVMLTMRLNRTEEDRARIEGALDMLESEGWCVDARDESGYNVLWGALAGARATREAEGTEAGEEVTPVVRMLLERGARANQMYGMSGDSSLHMAVVSGVAGVVEAVLEHGGDVNARDDRGRTALHVACERKLADDERPRVVELLIAAGASNINVRDVNGLTPLHVACKHGNDSIVETLLVAGADWRARIPSGESPVMLAYSRAKGSGVIAEILKFVESLEGDAAVVEETELFRRASGANASSSPAERCVREDISLVKWCAREQVLSDTISSIVNFAPSGKIVLFPADTFDSDVARAAATRAYMESCDFELDDVGETKSPASVAVALYRKYGDVLSSFIRYNQSMFPISLRESFADEKYNENLPLDVVARAVYAQSRVADASEVAVPSMFSPSTLHSPIFVAFESIMAQTVEPSFGFAPFIVDKARAWMSASVDALVAVTRGGAYVAARAKDDMNIPTEVIVLRDDGAAAPACFVEDAVTMDESSFTKLNANGATLLVELEPGDGPRGTALLELAVDAYDGDVVIVVNARQDEEKTRAILKSRGFVEHETRRATTFTAAGRPYGFHAYRKT